MFNFFIKNNNLIKYSKEKYSKWDFIQRRYNDQMNIVLSYYYNKDRAINNSNMLSRVLDTALAGEYIDIFEFIKKVSANARYVSKMFDITSNINYGKIHNNVVYGIDSKEIFLYIEPEIDVFDIENNWLNYRSLRAIYTEKTELDFAVPFQDISNNNRLTVFEIDIIGMCVQYWYWKEMRISMDKSTDTNVFIATIVLPNSLPTIMDLSIYNRFLNISKNTKNANTKQLLPFNVLDYTKGIDKILKTISKTYKGHNIPLQQLLDTIPTLYHTSMLDVIRIKHNIFTTQSYWVLVISRLKYISDLIDFLGKKGLARNTEYTSSLPLTIKRIRNTNYTILDKRLKNKIKKYLNNIDNKIGKR